MTDISIDSSSDEKKKICLVCGDKALGYNFNAITCESCKAFFRRNALKKKVFKCRFSGECDITMSTRRYCQKCRLKKCLQVGMMSELITVQPPDHYTNSPAKLARKRHSSFTNQANTDYPSSKLFASPFNPSPQSSSIVNYSPHQLFASPINHSPHQSTSVQSQSNSIFIDPSEYNLPSIPSSQQLDPWSPPKLTNMSMPIKLEETDPLIPCSKSVFMSLLNLCQRDQSEKKICVCKCICGASETTTVSSMDKSVSCLIDIASEKKSKERKCWTSRVFSDDDQLVPIVPTGEPAGQIALDLIRNDAVVEFPPDIDAWKLFRLEELLSANEILAHPRHNNGPFISYADDSIGADMFDLAIRRAWEMVRNVNAFSSLTNWDQIILFKRAIRELSCLRGTMVYEPRVNSYRPVGYPHRYLRIDCMSREKEDGYIFKKYMESFATAWRKCDPIMLCLACIVLFDPTRPNLIDTNMINFQRQYYQNLLKCYLRTVYTPLEANDVYKKLLTRLLLLKKHINEFVPIIHMEISAREMEPLLIDVIPTF